MNKKTVLPYGLLLIGVSLLPFLIDSKNTYVLSFSYMFFMAGFGMVFDFMDLKITGRSFMSQSKLPIRLFRLFIISVTVAVIMELSGNIVGNFWFYPLYSFGQYLSLIIFNFFTYTFLMLEGYWAFKSLVSRVLSKSIVRKNHPAIITVAKVLKQFWIIALVTFLVALKFQKFPGSMDGLINEAFYNQVPLIVFFIFAISVWLFFEAASFLRNGETILFDLLKWNYRNIVYALTASLVTSIVFEYYNLFFGFWVYDNIPFSQHKFLNIPIAVFIVWPLQYLALVPMYSFLVKKIESR